MDADLQDDILVVKEFVKHSHQRGVWSLYHGVPRKHQASSDDTQILNADWTAWSLISY